MNLTSLAILASLVSGLAGLAALLRSGLPLTLGSCTSAFLNSGLLGGSVFLVWYESFPANQHALVGICILIGLGGMPSIDFLLKLFRRGGFSIRFDQGRLDIQPNRQSQPSQPEQTDQQSGQSHKQENQP